MDTKIRDFKAYQPNSMHKGMVMRALKDAGYFDMSYSKRKIFCSLVLYESIFRLPCTIYHLEIRVPKTKLTNDLFFSESLVNDYSLEQLTSYFETLIIAYCTHVFEAVNFFPGL